MLSWRASLSTSVRLVSVAGILLAMFAWGLTTQAQSAYVRVSQVGYEACATPFRAYLMSSAEGGGAKFKVVDSKGATAFSGHVGPSLGIWSHSRKLAYNVYALDFKAPAGDLSTLSVSGPVAAISPQFAVDRPEALYSGLLLNSLFFYE